MYACQRQKKASQQSPCGQELHLVTSCIDSLGRNIHTHVYQSESGNTCAFLQATAAAQINASVLTAGDYTVYVTGLSHDVTKADLIEYASHYGEVGNVCPCKLQTLLGRSVHIY